MACTFQADKRLKVVNESRMAPKLCLILSTIIIGIDELFNQKTDEQ